MTDATPSPSESDILLQWVQHRYGLSLDPDALAEVRQHIDGARQLAAALRSVSLNNRDEPLTRFAPYRQEV